MKRITKGWGPWRKEFYSFYSNPRSIAEQVEKGNYDFGAWRNVWTARVSRLVYGLSPRLWRWWANRPNSEAKRSIERCFPKLRSR